MEAVLESDPFNFSVQNLGAFCAIPIISLCSRTPSTTGNSLLLKLPQTSLDTSDWENMYAQLPSAVLVLSLGGFRNRSNLHFIPLFFREQVFEFLYHHYLFKSGVLRTESLFPCVVSSCWVGHEHDHFPEKPKDYLQGTGKGATPFLSLLCKCEGEQDSTPLCTPHLCWFKRHIIRTVVFDDALFFLPCYWIYLYLKRVK